MIEAKKTPQLKPRHWAAKLELDFEARDGKTALVTNTHYGPLRVQRPFYPERPKSPDSPDCCHVYLLHPPGGLVLGDSLEIQLRTSKNARALITTPSAGKVYGVESNAEAQSQTVIINAEPGTCIEWLPQETIVFDGANVRLTTQLNLSLKACAIAWDIVCLGRPASDENFQTGSCHQVLEIFVDGMPRLIERNFIEGGSKLQKQAWGLKNCNSLGTLCATVVLERVDIDKLLEQLQHHADKSELEQQWGLTQKGELFIARYLGNSSRLCREGFVLIWQSIRPKLNNLQASIPRIWNT